MRHSLLQHPQLAGSRQETHFWDFASGLIDKSLSSDQDDFVLISKYSHMLQHGNSKSAATGRAVGSAYRRVAAGEAFVFDTTPAYSAVPLVPHRIAAVMPWAKIVLVLRDPVERYFSSARMQICNDEWDTSSNSTSKSYQTAGYHSAGAAAQYIAAYAQQRAAYAAECLKHRRKGTTPACTKNTPYIASPITRGLYAEQLARWLEHFSRQQLLIVDSSRLFSAAFTQCLQEVTAFAGLPQHNYTYDADKRYGSPNECSAENAAVYSGYYNASVASGDVQLLYDFYVPFNAELSELAGMQFNWTMHTSV
jgi:Sulfotransferase domain